MPTAPLRPCTSPGCGALVERGPCPDHQRAYEQRRGSSHQRGYDHRWRKAAAAWLRAHPLCVECAKHDVVCAATQVDHVKPHRGDTTLFWDRANWQGLCTPCHSRKTATEDGRWGQADAVRSPPRQGV